jgi:hypothetical protein
MTARERTMTVMNANVADNKQPVSKLAVFVVIVLPFLLMGGCSAWALNQPDEAVPTVSTVPTCTEFMAFIAKRHPEISIIDATALVGEAATSGQCVR